MPPTACLLTHVPVVLMENRVVEAYDQAIGPSPELVGHKAHGPGQIPLWRVHT